MITIQLLSIENCGNNLDDGTFAIFTRLCNFDAIMQSFRVTQNQLIRSCKGTISICILSGNIKFTGLSIFDDDT